MLTKMLAKILIKMLNFIKLTHFTKEKITINYS